jgi:hypothetical protein
MKMYNALPLWGKILVGLFLVGLLVDIGVGVLSVLTGNSPESILGVPTPEPVTPTSPPIPTPTQTQEQMLAGLIPDTLGQIQKTSIANQQVSVTDYFEDDTGKGATLDAIKQDCFVLQQAIWQSSIPTSGVTINITGPLVDPYGKQSTGNIGVCVLTRQTEGRFDWSGLDRDSAWGVYDSTWVLPDILS